MVGANVIAADTEKEAQYWASSHLHWVNILHHGRPGPLPLPQDGYLQRIAGVDRRGLEQALAYTAVGDVNQVGAWLRQLIDFTQADELIIDARIHDPQARCRSYQLAAESLKL